MPETILSNAQLARQWFEEVWNQGRKDRISELCHPEMKAYGLGAEPLGVAQFHELWDVFNESLGDIRVDLHDVIESGDRTASRFTISGVHKGYGLGMPPSGKSIQFEGQAITRWKDGLIFEAWNVLDLAAFYRQIGILSA